MKKIILYLLICFPALLYAQENNSGQSIELPEFVITGKQNVNIPTARKAKPIYVSILSKEYMKPAVSTEQMALSNISDPLSQSILLYDKLEYNNGLLKLGAGLHTLPIGQFNYSQNLEDVILRADISGVNIDEYIDNAGYNDSKVGLGFDWFNNNNAEFLPGLRINLNASYFRNDYKFYGSEIDPTFKRETEKMFGDLTFSSFVKNSVNYSLKLYGDNLKLKENDLSELLYGADGFIKIKASAIHFDLYGFYKNQSLKNSVLTDDKFNFYGGKGLVKINSGENIEIGAGVFYAKQGDNNLFSPVGTLLYRINSKTTLYGEYAPKAEFATIKNFIAENRYFVSDSLYNSFTEYKNRIKAAVQYQYNQYYEINVGAEFSKINGLVYFEDDGPQGIFNTFSADDVSKLNVFANFLYHPGPFGVFYADVQFNQIKFDGGNKVPYTPMLTGNVSYGFNIDSSLRTKFGLTYIGKVYSDAENINKLPAVFDLSAMVGYEFIKNFEVFAEVQNILNKKNYRYNNYQEKPFDVLLGINYRW